MFKVHLVVASVMLLVLATTANADFVFTKPSKPLTFTTVGETEEVLVKNEAGVTEVPKFAEAQKNNLNKASKQYIGIDNTFKTLKSCEVGIPAGGTCEMLVEYKINRGTEPIPEFWLLVEPPRPCPNMTPKFSA